MKVKKTCHCHRFIITTTHLPPPHSHPSPPFPFPAQSTRRHLSPPPRPRRRAPHRRFPSPPPNTPYIYSLHLFPSFSFYFRPPLFLSLRCSATMAYSSSSPPSLSYLAFFLLAVLLSVTAANAAHQKAAAAPAPAADCSTVVLALSDCLTFVLNGSTTTKPEGTCCSGLETVLNTNADCLCQTFKSSGEMGIALNVTKALTLPSACKLKTPPMSSCQLSMAPAGSPGKLLCF
ncbi:unnamed protein product [Linum tenue]|uniref:Bifunctional inhibitor/plant lipid transfer protein/seed storage helical domain-containing protein n=1 Tax=Linum tenue TaxID=586396 RepID=A0AAV0S8F3_9ROSI|nr:unnamed protein product [Linum tenue]